MFKYFFLTFFLFFVIIGQSFSLNLWSESAIIVDYDTEQVLFRKNIDHKIPPASMTKLVTIYLVYKYLDRNKIDIKSLVNISSNADWRNLPRDSSLMFLEQGQKVTYEELLIGLAIPSGNDAAIAISEAVSGSVEEFVNEMNKEMDELGFKNLKFVEPSGYSDDNSISVKEFVEFCLIFLKEYPDALNNLFSKESFTYPKPSNGKTTIGGIKQYNRNPMLELYPGCDGLKTGFIHKSGMNVALTASKDNRRVLIVLAGVKDEIKEQAEHKRILDSTKLLDFGLDKDNIYLDKLKLPPIKIKNGTKLNFIPYIPYKKKITVGVLKDIKYDIDYVTAPINVGDKIGHVYFKVFNDYLKYPIYSNVNIQKKSIINTFLNK